MVKRNDDQWSFRLGLISCVIGAISLVLTCVGVALPSWYLGQSANNTINYAQANLFYSCFTQNFTQNSSTPTQVCTAYSLFTCSTGAYQKTVLNVTASVSGCLNPTNGSAAYASFDGPIYQVYLDDYYLLRSAAALSIVAILFLFVATLFSLLVGLLKLNIFLVILPSIFGVLGIIFGAVCLELSGSVFISDGIGYILYIIGILLHLVLIILMSIVAGRTCSARNKQDDSDEHLVGRDANGSAVHVRRVLKRRVPIAKE